MQIKKKVLNNISTILFCLLLPGIASFFIGTSLYTYPMNTLCNGFHNYLKRQLHHQFAHAKTFRMDALSSAYLLDNSTHTLPRYQSKIEKPLRTVFDVNIEHGRCVGVEMDRSKDLTEISWQNDIYLQELQFGMCQPAGVRFEYLAGRVAMRRALGKLSSQIGPIFRNRHGAPSLPHFVRGSISHKNEFAVALVKPNFFGTVGVDIEVAKPPRSKQLAMKIMSERERYLAGNLKGISKEVETLLHFSMKEALYKALHPYVHRHIGWDEAEVFPFDDGNVAVNLMLKDFDNNEIAVSGKWLLLDNGMFLTTALAKH
jgi:4'-phosphopantetheinyl transferase EntD